MSRFTDAADWLQAITGAPEVVEANQAQKDLLLQDAHNMSDLEARDRASRHAQATNGKPAYIAGAGDPMRTTNVHQPKPKFVAHKTPKIQHTKTEKKSDRLGEKHA